MSKMGLYFAFVICTLVYMCTNLAAAAEEKNEAGVCSRQLNNNQNITVVAAPGPAGPKGDMGPRGQGGMPGEKGVAGAPGERGTIGPAGEKGEKGEPTGEKGDTGEQGPAGEKGSPGASPPAAPVVAFSVVRTTGIDKPSSYAVVTYDVVLSNVGGAYNQETGKFVPTVGGLYFFTFTGMTKYAPYTRCLLRLMKNGEKMVGLREITGGQSQHLSSSNSAILQLQPGDEVWVQLDGGHSLYGSSDRELTFSGFLIHAV